MIELSDTLHPFLQPKVRVLQITAVGSKGHGYSRSNTT